MFVVQEEKREYGWDADYACSGGITECWIDEDGDEIDVSAYENPWDDDTLRRTGYIDRWEYVTVFFTRNAAEAYIDNKAYRHSGKLRVYVDSACDNPEWQAVVAHLRAQKDGP
jgi:hypothetical protein